MKLRSVVKAATATALVGVYSRLRRRRSARGGAFIHVLGYHRVVDRIVEDGPISPSLCVTAATFRGQMQQVKRDFRVLSFAETVAAIEGQLRLDRDACTITFDDGYHDLYTRAAPILAELGIPATAFVATGFVGTKRRFTHDRLYAALWQLGRGRIPGTPASLVDALIARLPATKLEELAQHLEERAGGVICDDDSRVLDPAELKSLAESGWEIGSHTIDHTVLPYEPRARIEDQLLLPKIDLETLTGKPCRYFAYCNGLHSPELVEALERCGYQGAVTTRDCPNRQGGDRFRVTRKVLWEGHARGLDGKFSARVSAANLHDLFGALGLTRPVEGAVPWIG